MWLAFARYLKNAFTGVVNAICVRRERLTVALALQEQVALIALQDRLGDLLRACQPALQAPRDEEPHPRRAAPGHWSRAPHPRRLRA